MNLQQAFLNVSQRIPTNDGNISKRLNRAYDIIKGTVQDNIYAIEGNGYQTYTIKKTHSSLFGEETTEYTVNIYDKTCSCPDFETARSGLCKHRLAVMILMEMQKQ